MSGLASAWSALHVYTLIMLIVTGLSPLECTIEMRLSPCLFSFLLFTHNYSCVRPKSTTEVLPKTSIESYFFISPTNAVLESTYRVAIRSLFSGTSGSMRRRTLSRTSWLLINIDSTMYMHISILRLLPKIIIPFLPNVAKGWPIFGNLCVSTLVTLESLKK